MRDILPELNGKDYIDDLHKDYDIGFCKLGEVDELIDFLKTYWKEDHIFVLSREVFDFQHLDKKNQRYNFVLARERKSGDLHSVLGFVPTSQYDSNISSMMVWPCIWKSRDDIKRKGLGVSLYHYLKETLPIETISILGISEIALSIYKHWNFETGKIEQFFMPNYEICYNLSSGMEQIKKSESNKEDVAELKLYSEEMYDAIELSAPVFKHINKYKSKEYYKNRFFKHPVYEYKFYGIEQNKEVLAIAIARVCGNDEATCLRIVDYIGSLEALSFVKRQMQQLLQEENREYVDFVEVGLSEKVLSDAGFISRKYYPDIILPNYFEPFCKANIDLDYAYKTVVDDSVQVFYKADADQDRPNMLR